MTPDEAARTRDRVQLMGKGARLLTHGIVQPNSGPWQATQSSMHALVEQWKVDAWKLYTVWGPNREGYRLNDDLGMRTLQQGIDLGVPLFAVHKACRSQA